MPCSALNLKGKKESIQEMLSGSRDSHKTGLFSFVFLQSSELNLQSAKGCENSKDELSCSSSACFHEVSLEIMARVFTFRCLNIELWILSMAELPEAFMFRAGTRSTISKKSVSLCCLILGTKKQIYFRTQVTYGNIEIPFLSCVIHGITLFHDCEGKTWAFLV